jgi:hypothetical protein
MAQPDKAASQAADSSAAGKRQRGRLVAIGLAETVWVWIIENS